MGKRDERETEQISALDPQTYPQGLWMTSLLTGVTAA